MIVKELIEMLKQYDQNAEVVAGDGSNGFCDLGIATAEELVDEPEDFEVENNTVCLYEEC